MVLQYEHSKKHSAATTQCLEDEKILTLGQETKKERNKERLGKEIEGGEMSAREESCEYLMKEKGICCCSEKRECLFALKMGVCKGEKVMQQ